MIAANVGIGDASVGKIIASRADITGNIIVDIDVANKAAASDATYGFSWPVLFWCIM